jgi:hypothetical protein
VLLVICSQSGLWLTAVQLQLTPVRTVTATLAPVTPAAGHAADVGATWNEHAASCVSVNDLPAIVAVAVRGVVFGFASIV